MIFAAFKLGAAGITSYNLIQGLLVVALQVSSGNIWYPALPLLFQVDTKTGRPLIRVFTIFAGLLLILEAHLVWKYGFGQVCSKGTMAQVVTDLTGFRTTSLLEVV